MAEWNEEKLDETLQAIVNEMPVEDDLEKKIVQTINRRIRRVVYRTLAGIAVILLVAVLVINPLLNMYYFNPYELNKGEEQKMLGILRDYFETTQPYREVVGLEVEQKGFACYEIEMQVIKSIEPVKIGASNVWAEINFGKYENVKDVDYNLTHHMNRFQFDYTSQEKMIEKIKQLPESATIYLSVSAAQAESVEILKEGAATLAWFQVYQPNVDFQGGLSLNKVMLDSENAAHDEMTEAELLEVYVSNLENLMENVEVWEQFGLVDGQYEYFGNLGERVEETYKDAKQLTTLTSENYCVYGQRDEIVQFLQENTLDSIYVENVRLW